MRTRWMTVAALFLIWLVLAASYDVAHVLLGVVVALAVTGLNPTDPAGSPRKPVWWRVIAYFPWLFARILGNGFRLTRLILSPSLPIAPKLIHHRTKLASDAEVVLLGNSITLTPGTITVEVNSDELVVHAIDDVSGRDLAEGRLEGKIGQAFQTRKAER